MHKGRKMTIVDTHKRLQKFITEKISLEFVIMSTLSGVWYPI